MAAARGQRYEQQPTEQPSLRVIDVLRKHTFAFLRRHPRQAPPQVRGTMAKLSLCRTKALGHRTYECSACQHRCEVYNSCTDRHCPLCSGAKRADWLDKTCELLLPKIDYFQVVFTLPDSFSSLTLGNRREVYGLLSRSAWAALKELLQEEFGIEPAALLVLHTWNQELEHHPHIHALVPGGGPSLCGSRWVRTKHLRHRRRTKPYLTCSIELGRRFRDKFAAGLKRLHRRGELQLSELSTVRDGKAFAAWVDRIADQDWNVFIESPPKDASPRHVLKYLARYMSGGPISDRRLISHQDDQVTFWARSKNKRTGNRSRPFPLSGREFVRRWSLHILPKGFTKSRRYGGFSPRHRESYLARCRTLLQVASDDEAVLASSAKDESLESSNRGCPVCEQPMTCIFRGRRPSWRGVFADHSTCPWWYGFSSNDRSSHPPPDD